MFNQASEDTLDAWILVENKIVTYRLLSRLLRIHVDSAKEIMEEWHGRHPTTHATYVIVGQSLRNPAAGAVATPVMDPSSEHAPGESSLPLESVPRDCVQRIQLVAREDLEKAKLRFISVLSETIYSLEPARLSDMSMIASCKHDVQEAMKGQSTKIMDLSKTYGTIFNAGVHKMDENPRKRIAPPERVIKPIMKVQEPALKVLEDPKLATVKKESSSTSVRIGPQEPAPTEKKVPALKRNASSSLASAFAKTQKPKVKTEMPAVAVTATKATTSACAVLPTTKKEISLGGGGGGGTAASEQKSKQQAAQTAALRQMMEVDDDEVLPDSPAIDTEIALPQAGARGDTERGGADEDMLDAEEWSASDTEMKEVVVVPEPVKVIEPVRKRSRKKVKKQVHTKDAKGYMVTKEEWEWVSCDEEDLGPTTATAPVRPHVPVQSKAKPALKKKGSGGAGIASYFTKK